jgi:hypothetical protein
MEVRLSADKEARLRGFATRAGNNIRVNLGAPQGSNLRTSLGGRALVDLSPNNGPLSMGYWDYSGSFTNYILNNVCLATSCN